MRSHPLLAFATAISAMTLAALGQATAASASILRPARAQFTKNPLGNGALSVLLDSVTTRMPPAGGPVHHRAPARPRSAPPVRHRFVPLGGVWAALRSCESGGDYGADTGNGYYGAYQFSLSTWHSLGRSGLPSSASPAMQDATAVRLQALAGWRPWPVCSIELGL